jgi:phage major head subunit gpT-like protein
MHELSKNNLRQARKSIQAFKNDIGHLSIEPTRIIIPPDIIDWLAEEGYDTQQKVDKLIADITST